MEEAQILNMIKEGTRIGYLMCEVDMAVKTVLITKAFAYRKYKRTVVDKWIANGDVKLVTNAAGRHSIDRLQIAIVAAAANIN